MRKQILKRMMAMVVLVIGILGLLQAQDAKTLPYKANWETDLEDWTVVDNKYNSKTWDWRAAGVAFITDSKRANDDWLISPAIDCSGKGAKKVSFSAGWNKAQSSNIALYYSTNYEGDQSAAEWVLVEEKIIPDSQPFGFKTAVYIPISVKVKVSAPKVHFAIRYMPHNEAEDSQNEIRIRNFKVTGK
jgi:Tfp pilus assembly protein PilV